MKTLKVHSAYNTISGEVGSDAIMQGSPVTVLRLYGCNLRCPYCDARDAVDGGTFQEMTIDEVVTLLYPLLKATRKLLITGGEPLLQEEALLCLADNLECRMFYDVIIETNGTLLPSQSALWEQRGAQFVVDIKYIEGTFHYHRNWFKENDLVSFFKLVVGNADELESTLLFIANIPNKGRFRFAISPVMDVNNLDLSFTLVNTLAKRLIEHADLHIHLNLQLHKLCNVE